MGLGASLIPLEHVREEQQADGYDGVRRQPVRGSSAFRHRPATTAIQRVITAVYPLITAATADTNPVRMDAVGGVAQALGCVPAPHLPVRKLRCRRWYPDPDQRGHPYLLGKQLREEQQADSHHLIRWIALAGPVGI